jgi:hypothetical protein
MMFGKTASASESSKVLMIGNLPKRTFDNIVE